MGQLETGDWAGINAISEAEVLREADNSAHETKNWMAAFAADGDGLSTKQRWYRDIRELVAGFGSHNPPSRAH